MTTKTGVDDLDLEALQAQIDLTMAYAHELASSWVNPSLKSSGESSRGWEKELEQHMRRPPRYFLCSPPFLPLVYIRLTYYRLGVGAPIPEGTTGHRELTRLKNNLTKKGKKREREKAGEGEEERMQVSSDEGESRASAIKKKPKPDAFGGSQNAKGKKNGSTLPTGRSSPARSIVKQSEEDVVMESCENEEASNEVQSTASTHVRELSKSAMKKQKKIAAVGSGHASAPASAPSSPKDIASSKRTNSLANNTDHIKRWHPPMSPSRQSPYSRFLYRQD
jgi:hypothetical protein